MPGHFKADDFGAPNWQRPQIWLKNYGQTQQAGHSRMNVNVVAPADRTQSKAQFLQQALQIPESNVASTPLDDLKHLFLGFTVLPVTGGHFRAATKFVDQHTLGLRAGDAPHLAAAEHRAPAHTLDQRLAQAGPL